MILDADIAQYAKTVGPEPVIDRKKPDLVGQHQAWVKWWLDWYKLPVSAPAEPK